MTRPIRPAITVKVSPRSRPARISSRSPIDRRAADGFQSAADAGLGSRTNTLVTACLEHSTIRPISRRPWPLAASRRTSRSNSDDNRFICALLSELTNRGQLTEVLRGSLEPAPREVDPPRRGVVPPDVFIPIAERTGMIVELGAAVLGTACDQAAVWRRDHPD